MKQNKYLEANAKNMRKEMTTEEAILWNLLRNKQFREIKFRRQVVIAGRYIADFLAYDAMVVIELDGSQHANPTNIEYDEERTKILNALGFKVIRIWNDEILNNIDGVYKYLENEISYPPHQEKL